MKKTIIIWILRLVPSAIMLQTLIFKFTGSPESVYIFSTLGVEPWGRILSGIMELVAGILLLVPRTTVFGALMGLGVMAGAIMSHLTLLGIEVMNDGGLLFLYAVITFICCGVLVMMQKQTILEVIHKLRKS